MFLISNTVMWAGIAAISVAIMLICVGIGFIIFDYIKSSIIYFLVSVLFVIIGVSCFTGAVNSKSDIEKLLYEENLTRTIDAKDYIDSSEYRLKYMDGVEKITMNIDFKSKLFDSTDGVQVYQVLLNGKLYICIK